MTIQDSWLVNQFIAHRGFHNKENPENTLGAFQQAIEHNYAIECDIQMLVDGTLVVIHDKVLSRLTGVDGYIENFTWKEISKLKINNTKFGIPSVQQMLDCVQGQVPILFEIKNFSRKKIGDLESQLCDLLAKYKGEFAVQSFNPFVMQWFQEKHPDIIRGLLSSSFKGADDTGGMKVSGITRWFLSHLKMAKHVKPDFIAYRWIDLPNRFVRQHKTLPVLAWTIRSQEEYMQVVKYADNIIFEGFEPKI